MAKKTSSETDEVRLKKKVKEQLAASGRADRDPRIRALHKRLKRAQRKRRRLAARKGRAMGKKAGAADTGGAPSTA